MTEDKEEELPKTSYEIMGIISVSKPKYSHADNLAINCTVEIMRHGKHCGEHIFTAAAHDPDLHGRELYNDLIAGKYGEIAPYDG